MPTEGRPRCRSGVDRGSIEVSIASIDRHSIAGVKSTHDPITDRSVSERSIVFDWQNFIVSSILFDWRSAIYRTIGVRLG